jgi:carboxypeptidase Q
MPPFDREACLTAILAASVLALPVLARAAPPALVESYRPLADRIIAAARADRAAWDRLAELTDTFGHRLTGSPQLEAAIRWAAEEMRRDGLENVRLEKVRVPHWVRGRESLEIVEPVPSPLVLLGLGGSEGTRPEGVAGELMVVKSFDELEARAAEARGRVVLFNVPFTSYGETVRYRGSGASRAARHGALAMLLRSVGPPGLRTPHTGGLRYEDGVARIPAAAVPVEDADRLQRLLDRGRKVVVRLTMEARTLPETESANVVGEIVGRERPDEVVLVGGHFDSWDVGTGAMDDGGGCVVTWEALRLLKRLGLRPRRTVRVVLFTNEENGLRGGLAYRDARAAELDKHVLALESDSGAFRPRGFGFTGSESARVTVTEVARLLRPIGADRVGPSGGGADIGPSVDAARIPSMSLEGEGERYFLYHHTPADTADKLSPDDLSLGTAAVAVMAYVVADLPEALPR